MIREVQAQGSQYKEGLTRSIDALRVKMANVGSRLVDTSGDARSSLQAVNPPASGDIRPPPDLRPMDPLTASSPRVSPPAGHPQADHSAGSGAVSRSYRPRVKLDPLQIPKFTGSIMDFPEWRSQFTAIMDAQEMQDQVLLIYLRGALPKEYAYLLTGVRTMEGAWTR